MSARASKILGAILFTAAFAACGGPPEPAKPPANEEETAALNEQKAGQLLARARKEKSVELYKRLDERFPGTKAREEGMDELSGLWLSEAEASLEKGDRDHAEYLADEAKRYALLENTKRAQVVLDKVDDERIELTSKATLKHAEAGKCGKAAREVATSITSKSRPRYIEGVRGGVKQALFQCLEKQLQVDVDSNKQKEARARIATSDLRKAFSPKGYQELERMLQKLIVKKSVVSIDPLLKKHQWKAALAKLDELEKSKTITSAERGTAFDIVRDAIHQRVLEQAAQGLTAARPSQVLASIQEQAKLADWKEQTEELQKALAKLDIVLQCEKLGCRIGRAKKAWVWGNAPVHPVRDANAKPGSQLSHTQEIWTVSTRGDKILVAAKKPTAKGRAELLDEVLGWVNQARLKPHSTEDWLPPAPELVGARVWGPLRAPKKSYHLGTVVKVKGNKVTVKRLADGRLVEVSLASLRMGTLQKGLRVMAFCVNPLHPERAKIESVVSEAGEIKVKVVCARKAKERVEVGGALSTQVQWLPPRKP